MADPNQAMTYDYEGRFCDPEHCFYFDFYSCWDGEGNYVNTVTVPTFIPCH